MPGGKIFKFLKGPAVKLGIKKLENQLLKIAAKKAMKAIDVKFLDKKELAKRLKINPEKVHDAKEDIVKSFRNILNKKGIKNPDICVDKTGNIVLRHPATKEIIPTNIPLSSFEK